MIMEQYCDLHVHSCYSDGTCTPEQILQLACEAGLQAVALCDHNTVDGLEDLKAHAANYPIEAICGIEVSTDFEGTELHILGLGVEPAHYAPIQELMSRQKQLKEKSNRDLAQALNAAGYAIDYDAIRNATPSGNVNRALIAAELTRLGYTESVQAAFKQLLSPKHGYYVPPKHPDAVETVAWLKQMGLRVIIAHPLLSMEEAQARRFLPLAVAAGLDGMEVLYPKYDEDTTALAMSLCKAFSLLPSGGSDFHGENKPDIRIGIGRGNLQIPMQYWLDIQSVT